MVFAVIEGAKAVLVIGRPARAQYWAIMPAYACCRGSPGQLSKHLLVVCGSDGIKAEEAGGALHLRVDGLIGGALARVVVGGTVLLIECSEGQAVINNVVGFARRVGIGGTDSGAGDDICGGHVGDHSSDIRGEILSKGHNGGHGGDRDEYGLHFVCCAVAVAFDLSLMTRIWRFCDVVGLLLLRVESTEKARFIRPSIDLNIRKEQHEFELEELLCVSGAAASNDRQS